MPAYFDFKMLFTKEIVCYYLFMKNLCEICPRNCKKDRVTSLGFCGAPSKLIVAHADLHFGEEPFISGKSGSGTIFFSHCNLKCVFCQNAPLRDGKIGKEITVERLIELYKRLESLGASNINLVSPMHYATQIVESLKIYKPKIPIVWNSNGYEKVETIQGVSKYIDVFLPDLKFCDSELSTRLAQCPNYFEVATKAILEMRKQKPNDIFNKNGIMQSGVAIRHLILPNHTKDSKKIIDFLSENLPTTTISLMSQYVPYGKATEIQDINRALKPIEYNNVLSYAKNKLRGNIFSQDLASATTQYIPKWNPDSI